MKHFWNIIFWSLGGIALGIGIGITIMTHTTLTSQQSAVTAISSFAVTAVLVLAGVIMSAVILQQNKARQNVAVTFKKKDIILQTGTVYTVTKRGQIRPGEYTILATDEQNRTFNLRVNDYVKEYQHNTTLVLAEGDTISARSANVILR